MAEATARTIRVDRIVVVPLSPARALRIGCRRWFN
jgi:hypothetical protein